MDVAITGAGSATGRRLVAALATSTAVERVIALDAAPVSVPAGVTAGVIDVRDDAMADRLAGVDVLVHLEVGDDPRLSDAVMADRNVAGTVSALESALEAGCSRIVVVTSASVYGAAADNDVPLSESSPRRAPVDAPGARHVAAVEAELWERATTLPAGTTLTVLRPAPLVGEGVDGPVQALVGLPRLPVVVGHRAPVQLAHVDDLVAALVLAVTTDLPGAYNVASPGWVSVDEAAAVVHRRTVAVPEEVARAVADTLWRAGVTSARSSRIDYLMHPCVVDVRRLESAGWLASHSNRDALVTLADTESAWLRLGTSRVRRDRAAIVAIASVVAATGAGVAAAAAVSRRLRE